MGKSPRPVNKDKTKWLAKNLDEEEKRIRNQDGVKDNQ